MFLRCEILQGLLSLLLQTLLRGWIRCFLNQAIELLFDIRLHRSEVLDDVARAAQATAVVRRGWRLDASRVARRIIAGGRACLRTASAFTEMPRAIRYARQVWRIREFCGQGFRIHRKRTTRIGRSRIGIHPGELPLEAGI